MLCSIDSVLMTLPGPAFYSLLIEISATSEKAPIRRWRRSRMRENPKKTSLVSPPSKLSPEGPFQS